MESSDRSYDYDDVDARWAEIDDTAKISEFAVAGSPGEWVGKPTVHPAIIGPGVVLREFSRVHAGCERPTVIGEGTLLMAGSHVGHDAILGRHVHLAPNVVIGGLAEIGDHSHIGLGASVLPKKTVGSNCIVGAGSVVTKDIPDGEVWAGNPATFRKKTERSMPAH